MVYKNKFIITNSFRLPITNSGEFYTKRVNKFLFFILKNDNLYFIVVLNQDNAV